MGERRGRPKENSQSFDTLPDGRTDVIAGKNAGFKNHETVRQAERVVDKGAPELVDAMDTVEAFKRRKSARPSGWRKSKHLTKLTHFVWKT